MAKGDRYIGGGATAVAERVEEKGDGDETTSPDKDAEGTPGVEPATAPATAPETTPEPATAEPAVAEADAKVTLLVHLGEQEEEKAPELIFHSLGAAKFMEQCQNLERFSTVIQRAINAILREEAPKGMSHGTQKWFLQTYSLMLLVEETASEGQAILTGAALVSPDGDIIR